MTEKTYSIEWSQDTPIKQLLRQIHEKQIPKRTLRYLRGAISTYLGDIDWMTPEESLNIT